MTNAYLDALEKTRPSYVKVVPSPKKAVSSTMTTQKRVSPVQRRTPLKASSPIVESPSKSPSPKKGPGSPNSLRNELFGSRTTLSNQPQTTVLLSQQEPATLSPEKAASAKQAMAAVQKMVRECPADYTDERSPRSRSPRGGSRRTTRPKRVGEASPQPETMTVVVMSDVDPPPASEDSLRLEDWSYDDLTQYFKELFAIGDENGDGVLQPEEVRSLCEMSGFNMTPEMVDTVIKEADKNNDGVIDYTEFVPMLLSLLGNDQKSNELDLEEIAAMSPEIVAASTESLKSYFMCVFAIADENQDGVLSKSEVKELLTACGYDLDAAAVSRLVDEADTNDDGVLQYEEFVPMILKMLGKIE